MQQLSDACRESGECDSPSLLRIERKAAEGSSIRERFVRMKNMYFSLRMATFKHGVILRHTSVQFSVSESNWSSSHLFIAALYLLERE